MSLITPDYPFQQESDIGNVVKACAVKTLLVRPGSRFIGNLKKDIKQNRKTSGSIEDENTRSKGAKVDTSGLRGRLAKAQMKI